MNKRVAKLSNLQLPSDTHPVDGDERGGGEQLARLCGNVLGSTVVSTLCRPPERPAWVLPFVVTLRSAALSYQSALRAGRQPEVPQLSRGTLAATQIKMDRWPVKCALPAWLDERIAANLLARLGVDSSLSEPRLIDWLSEPGHEKGCNFPGSDSDVDLPA